MQDFIYERPETIGEAIAAMRADDARALAGGTDLVPQLREGRRRAARIVDLKQIPEMTAITVLPGGGVSIGAAASATAVARHAAICGRLPGRCRVRAAHWRRAGAEPREPWRNICNAAPSADGVPALICHGAQALIAGPEGTREMPVEAIFAGPGRTTLAAGELLIAIRLPPVAPIAVGAYRRFTPRREMDIAIAGAGAWLRLGARWHDRGSAARARLSCADADPCAVGGAKARG